MTKLDPERPVEVTNDGTRHRAEASVIDTDFQSNDPEYKAFTWVLKVIVVDEAGQRGDVLIHVDPEEGAGFEADGWATYAVRNT